MGSAMAAVKELKNDDLDLDTDAVEPVKKKGGINKLLLPLGIGAILVLATGGVTFLLTGGFSSDDKMEIDVLEAGKTAAKKDGAKKDAAKKPDAKKGAPVNTAYLPLEPPFTVNFENEGYLRFLQISMEVLVRDPLVVDEIKKHMPVIRNNMIMLLSNQSYASLSSREGKEKLRTEALAEIQKTLKDKGIDSGVDAIYFTNFVMQ